MSSASAPSIAVVGGGPAGLITALVLLQDGFTNLLLFTRDAYIGGRWAREHIVPGSRMPGNATTAGFSSLPLSPDAPDGHVSADSMAAYLHALAEKHLPKHHLRLRCDVQSIRRSLPATGSKGSGGTPWEIVFEDLSTGALETLHFARIVLCTGRCSKPRVPRALGHHAAERARFHGLVLHSSAFAQHLPDILARVKPGCGANKGRVVVIGGGSSARDICVYLALEGRQVTVVFDPEDVSVDWTKAMPRWLRKDRLLAVLCPQAKLRTRLARFLQATWVGNMLLSCLSYILVRNAMRHRALDMPDTSGCRLKRRLPQDASIFIGAVNPQQQFKHQCTGIPSRRSRSSSTSRSFESSVYGVTRRSKRTQWTAQLERATNVIQALTVQADGTKAQGLNPPSSFHALVNAGLVNLVAPARAVGYGEDGWTVALSSGEAVPADVVVLATGYRDQGMRGLRAILDEPTAVEIGIERNAVEGCSCAFSPSSDSASRTVVRCPSCASCPLSTSASLPSSLYKVWIADSVRKPLASLYRGVIPVKSIARRDIAVNGLGTTRSNGYTLEVAAHWISAYFSGEAWRVPETPEAAAATEERLCAGDAGTAWGHTRYPDALGCAARMWTWPSTTDDMLEDLGVKHRSWRGSARNGGRGWGAWVWWAFLPVKSEDLRGLGEERQRLREGLGKG